MCVSEENSRTILKQDDDGEEETCETKDMNLKNPFQFQIIL